MRKTILQDIQSIQNLVDTVWSVETLTEVLQEIVDRTASLIGANRVSLIVFDLSSQKVDYFFRGGPGASLIRLDVQFEELWQGLSGWVLRNRKPALSLKNRNDARESEQVKKRRRETHCGCILVVPLLRKDHILGTLTLINSPTEVNFRKDEIAITETIAHYCSIVVENARLLFDLKKAKKTAEESNRAKSEFLSIVSHELRTPLTSILGFSELLQKTELNSEQRQYARVIEISGASLLTVINDILDYSKMELGNLEIEQTRFSLRQMIDDVQMLFHSQAQEKGLEFTVQNLDPDQDLWEGDEKRIRQILINLLSNAFKFTEKGKVHWTIAIGVTASGEREIIFTIRDTGIGISAQAQKKVFHPFTQSESVTSRKYGGTGLGLTICLRLCELMNGSISMESAVGVGSAFTVKIPFRPLKEPDLTLASPHQKSLAILIVDDSEMNRFVVSQALKIMGHRAEMACDGYAALELCSAQRFDLILMDLSMPGLDGVETTLRIRSDSVPNRSTPIVAFTASIQEEDWVRAQNAGMSDLLEKPFKARQLSNSIERVLQRKQLGTNGRSASSDSTSA